MATNTGCGRMAQQATTIPVSSAVSYSRSTLNRTTLVGCSSTHLQLYSSPSARCGSSVRGSAVCARRPAGISSSTACRATGVLAGVPAAENASAAVVGEWLLRRWIGVSEKENIPTVQETGPLRDTSCELTVCGTAIEAKGRKHLLLAFVITDASNGSSSSGKSGNKNGKQVTDLRGPVLHWGCVAGKGDRWHAPPAGWSTWPDVSHDARGGAWQTPFTEQQLPGVGPALTMLLQLPCDGPLRSGGLAFLVKAGSNSWLGNGATYKDFFYETSQLPLVPADALAAAAAGVAAGHSELLGPETPLDMEKLASAPVQRDVGQKKDWRNKSHDNNGHNHNNHHHNNNGHHGQEPELPNAGRRAKEPANDETQVCTLTAAQLHAAAAGQLTAWAAQQHDLELPATGLDIMQHEWPVKGHPSTPFVAATAALFTNAPGEPRQPVLLLAALGDVGLTGKRVPGLVLQWSAVGAEGAALVAQKPDAAASGAMAVSALPDGWSTMPDLSWDAGSGFWDTPMTRHLFKDIYTAGNRLERPASPIGPAGAPGGGAADMYMVLMRLPLQDVFCSGGLLFNMRTSRRQWVRHGTTSGPFFLSTAAHAAKLNLLPEAPAAPATTDAGPGSSPLLGATGSVGSGNIVQAGGLMSSSRSPADAAAWEATHAALAAAGLSEEDIATYAARMPAAGPGLMHSPAADGGSSSNISAVLSSADAELAAHINKQSAASIDGLSAAGASSTRAVVGSGRDAAPPAGPGFDVLGRDIRDIDIDSAAAAMAAAAVQEVARGKAKGGASGSGSVGRFLREFDPEPLELDGVQWGLAGDDSATSDLLDVPELAPHPHLVGRIAELEHKACRSLMHRYGIAADLVNELLPDIKAAAKAAPHSLVWPPAVEAAHSSSSDVAARGRQALSGLVAVAVWLRLSALRLLVWNHNYNVKPREISAALDRLGANLIQVYEAAPQLAGVVLLAMSSAGRGGEGDMGQRIRDEILAIQHRNRCKGGMMEEWHQKLHNNSSPDDLAICQALLDYLGSGQQQQVYWDSLAAEGITPARLASYDRPIKSPPPTFPQDVIQSLTDDLIAYRRTLAAVHSGADLAAAIDGVLGYDAGECKGKRVKVEPLTAVASPRLRQLLAALLALVQGGSSSSSPAGSPGSSRSATPGPGLSSAAPLSAHYAGVTNSVNNSVNNSVAGGGKVSAMMDMERCLKVQALVVAARQCLAAPLRGGNSACQGRLRDVMFLDLALELTGRGALEQGLSAVRAAAPSTLLGGLLALLQQPLASTCLSALPGQGGNVALVGICRQLQRLSQECPGLDRTAKARHALSLMERLRSLLAAQSASATALLQPTAQALAAALSLPEAQQPLGPVTMLAEEVVRGSAAAALSLLLTAVEPSLRRLAGVGAWSIVSRLPSKITGTLSPLTLCLSQLQPGVTFSPARPTILVLQRLAGEEEVPPGVVGVVVLGDCPDVLSHAAVRARNCRVPVVSCPSSEDAQVSQVVALAGKQVQLSINGDDVQIMELHSDTAAAAAEPHAVAAADRSAVTRSAAQQQLTAPPSWNGSWVVTTEQFTPGAVGAKAMSAAKLDAAAATQLPAWLKVPPSIALPHGTFEAVLEAPVNGSLMQQLQQLTSSVAAATGAGSNTTADDWLAEQLDQIRSLVLQLQVAPGMQHELSQNLQQLAAAASSSGGNDSSYTWDGVWSSIKGVWASQWNARAVAALSKAQLPLQHLRMGVLLQPLLPARYSWVAHTVNPATGSASEVVVQLVVGLGEVLVGNHPGRALGGVIKRDSLTAALQQGLGSSSSSSGGISSVDMASLLLPPVPDTVELLSAVDVVSYPSKDAAIVPEGMLLPCSVDGGSSAGGSSSGVVFMARSDSNAEDLPGFAGAGLFDSIPTRPTQSVMIDYSKEPIVWDRATAAALLWQCALAAVAAEQAVSDEEDGADVSSSSMQGQDVEGCITADGSIWLLQARPQM